MTKTKKAAMSSEDKNAMDAVLRKMLATPPTVADAPKAPKKPGPSKNPGK